MPESGTTPWNEIFFERLERYVSVECFVDPEVDPQVPHVGGGEPVVGGRHGEGGDGTGEGHSVHQGPRRNVPNFYGGVQGSRQDPTGVDAEM